MIVKVVFIPIASVIFRSHRYRDAGGRYRPLADAGHAPPFATLSVRYPVAFLAEALAEGIIVAPVPH